MNRHSNPRNGVTSFVPQVYSQLFIFCILISWNLSIIRCGWSRGAHCFRSESTALSPYNQIAWRKEKRVKNAAACPFMGNTFFLFRARWMKIMNRTNKKYCERVCPIVPTCCAPCTAHAAILNFTRTTNTTSVETSAEGKNMEKIQIKCGKRVEKRKIFREKNKAYRYRRYDENCPPRNIIVSN